MTSPIPGYCRVADLAESAGVNESTVRRHIREGKLPAVAVDGRTWLIPDAAAAAYLADRREEMAE